MTNNESLARQTLASYMHSSVISEISYVLGRDHEALMVELWARPS